MPFRFALQALLHLRQSLEHQQELRLRAANQQVAQMQEGIERVEGRRRELQETQSRELGQGMTAAELRFSLECEAQLLRYKNELHQQLIRMQQLREQQRELFQQARIARETLEAVRDRQWQAYRQDSVRREQRDLDEMFLLRPQASRRG
jgi:flagellar export protein FliJ